MSTSPSSSSSPPPPSNPELCALCPKMCRFACPVAGVTGDETATPTAMLQAAREARAGRMPWAAAADALARCTGCEACRAPCEYDQDVPSMLYAARAEAWDAGGARPEDKALVQKDLDSGSVFGSDPRALLKEHGARGDFDRKGRVLYWPGCRALHEAAPRVAAEMTLLRALGADHVSLPARDDVPTCCGAPLRAVGDTAGFQVAAAGLQQYFNRQRTWVTGSSACLLSLRTGYPEAGVQINAEVLHLAEYLTFFEGRIGELGRQVLEQREANDQPPPRVVAHDACGLHRRLGRGDALHRVVQAATGQAPARFAESADRTVCCGAGDFHDLRRPAAASALSASTTAHADRSGRLAATDWLVTGDADCVGALAAGRGDGDRERTFDLVGFLLAWLAPVLGPGANA